MSGEARESPVWTDVVRVWTARDAFALDLKREGRRRADWWLLLALYFLVFSFSYWITDRLGDQELWDRLFDSPSEPKSAAQKLVSFLILCSLMVTASLLQWLILPQLSGCFGGGRTRPDANLAYYTGFAAGLLPEFVSVFGTAMGVSIERFASPFGAYFYLVFLLLTLSILLYWMARSWKELLNIPNLGRALALTFISIVVSLGAVLSIFYGIYLIFPDLVDYL